MISQQYDNNFDCVWHSWGNLYAFSPVEGQGLAFPTHEECENPTWALIIQPKYFHLGEMITVEGFDYFYIKAPIEGMIVQISNKDVYVYVQIGRDNTVTEVGSVYDGNQFSLNGEEVSSEEFEAWENSLQPPAPAEEPERFEVRGDRLVCGDTYTSHELSDNEIAFCGRTIADQSAEKFAHVSYDHQHTFDGALMNMFISCQGEMHKVKLHSDTPANISLYHTGKFAFWVVDEKAYFCNPTDYGWLQMSGEQPVKASTELLKLADDAWEITRRVLEILDPLLNESGESLPPLRYSTLQYISYWGVEVFYEGKSLRQSSGVEIVEKDRWDERFYNSHSGGEEIVEENSHRIFIGTNHNWKLEIFRL